MPAVTEEGLEDHPRACGVYLGDGNCSHIGVRIIPARAGFTIESPDDVCYGKDHPRACGVYPLAKA